MTEEITSPASMTSFSDLVAKIQLAPLLRTREAIWHSYLNSITDGSAVELGVYKGRSINYMAAVRPDAAFHGFDSFIGLQEQWKNYPVGHLATEFSALKFRENVTIHTGDFETTLPAYAKIRSGRVLQGVHVDCDLGSSTTVALRHLTQQILTSKPLLLFDEMYNYAGCEKHEAAAFCEWVNQHDVKFEVVARTSHEQVLIRLP